MTIDRIFAAVVCVLLVILAYNTGFQHGFMKCFNGFRNLLVYIADQRNNKESNDEDDS